MPGTQEFVTRPAAEIYGRYRGYGFAGYGVNTAIGNFTQRATDLSFPGGVLGLLDWTRTYNSLDVATGVLGPGWTPAFSAHLTTDPVTLHDEDGRVLPFTAAADGTFASPQDIDAALTRDTDGSYTLTYTSGLRPHRAADREVTRGHVGHPRLRSGGPPAERDPFDGQAAELRLG
jgi:hypothetical protein